MTFCRLSMRHQPKLQPARVVHNASRSNARLWIYKGSGLRWPDESSRVLSLESLAARLRFVVICAAATAATTNAVGRET